MLVHADLHNHTLLSDGAGRAEEAFAQMRQAGLDVAALTDHAIMGKRGGEGTCASGACTQVVGINETSWETLGRLADRADAPSEFVALRGFEWSTSSLGHVNVWFSQTWTDAASTNSLVDPRGVGEAAQLLPAGGPELQAALAPVLAALPPVATIDGFYDWLRSPVDRPVLGGGVDAIAGFNHPGLYGDFDGFRLDPGLVDRLVSVEALSFTEDDWLYETVDEGQASPIGRCLDAGWRTGMLGVSDQHGERYGQADTPRAGLWVRSLTRAGVREALLARRFFATRIAGLRLEATANRVLMGSTLRHRRGLVDVVWDLDHGPSWRGRRLVAQVLQSGSPLPTVVGSQEFRVPGPREPLPRLTVPVDVEDGRWLMLRLTDPDQKADRRATGPYVAAGRALAYASPFFLDPDAAPARR
jgi:hypothetical protein